MASVLHLGLSSSLTRGDLRSDRDGQSSLSVCRAYLALFVLLFLFLEPGLHILKHHHGCGFFSKLPRRVATVYVYLGEGQKQDTEGYHFCLKCVTKLVSLPSSYEQTHF